MNDNVSYWFNKDGITVCQSSCDSSIFEDFFKNENKELPESLIIWVDDFLSLTGSAIRVEDCDECHILDNRTEEEYICYDLKIKNPSWEIKTRKDIK